MNILVVNDDGISSPGLALLAESFETYGKVSVVAPHTEQSAISHGITIHDPIRLHRREDILPRYDSWSLEAKPADCVRFALYALKLNIDLVVSGINNGPNLGTDIVYSGTLAAASEGLVCGIPALAVSADFGSLDLPRKELSGLLERIIGARILHRDRLLNVNFPLASFEESRGIRITEMGRRPFNHDFVEEDGGYWSRGDWAKGDNGPETDVWAYENGYISLTPIGINRTDYPFMDTLKKRLHG